MKVIVMINQLSVNCIQSSFADALRNVCRSYSAQEDYFRNTTVSNGTIVHRYMRVTFTVFARFHLLLRTLFDQGRFYDAKKVHVKH